MAVLLVLMMLTAAVVGAEDLSGSMFTFPQKTNRAHVKLDISPRDFGAYTVCHRSFTDLERDHALFSLSTPRANNEVLIFWNQATGMLESFVRDQKVEYRVTDYKPNMWHSICTTWDSKTGLMQLWFDGRPRVKKFISSGSTIGGTTIVVLGQEQDSYGGDFDINQSFIGMMTDVHMWDYILSECEIYNYNAEYQFTPGNMINWKALDYQTVDMVILEKRFSECL